MAPQPNMQDLVLAFLRAQPGQRATVGQIIRGALTDADGTVLSKDPRMILANLRTRRKVRRVGGEGLNQIWEIGVPEHLKDNLSPTARHRANLCALLGLRSESEDDIVLFEVTTLLARCQTATRGSP